MLAPATIDSLIKSVEIDSGRALIIGKARISVIERWGSNLQVLLPNLRRLKKWEVD